MKRVAVENSSLDACITAAQRQRVLLTRRGRPVAKDGLSHMDEEELELRSSDKFWKLISARLVQLDNPPTNEWERLRELMRQYADTPMDLADASLVSAAERLGVRQILTLDSHFRAYRIHSKDVFEVVP